jgi:hypothetical protein
VQHVYIEDNDFVAYLSGDNHPAAAGNRKASAEFVVLLNVYCNRWKSGGICEAISGVNTTLPTAAMPTPSSRSLLLSRQLAPPRPSSAPGERSRIPGKAAPAPATRGPASDILCDPSDLSRAAAGETESWKLIDLALLPLLAGVMTNNGD